MMAVTAHSGSWTINQPGRLSPLCLEVGTPSSDTVAAVPSSPQCEALLRQEKLDVEGLGEGEN